MDGRQPTTGRSADAVIANPATAAWVSAVSAWEIVIKVMTGRLATKEPPEICIPRELKRQAFQSLSISTTHALAVRSLPKHHHDPFDRMLVAQARSEGLTVVTSDSILARYDVAVLDASV